MTMNKQAATAAAIVTVSSIPSSEVGCSEKVKKFYDEMEYVQNSHVMYHKNH